MGAPYKTINVIASQSDKSFDKDESKALNEEIRFLENHLEVPAPPTKGKVGIKVKKIETGIVISTIENGIDT